MPVQTPRSDFEAMLVKWKRVRDCSNGRDAVLKAGNKYVPDLPGTDTAGNNEYRQRGNFYNAVSRTINGMNGSIFQTAPKVDIGETFKALLDDLTLTNVSFESFATEVGKEVFITARYGVLVDMPIQPPGEAPRTDVDMRPYCVGYCAENIINWRTERRGGDEILSMVVLEEQVEIDNPADMFVVEKETHYRVMFLKGGVCVRQLYKPKSKGSTEYVMNGDEVILQRRGEPLDFVPFIFIGAVAPTPDLENPPLIDLADVNLAHWRNSVDHEYGLHLVALPTPWVSGSKGGADSAPMKIGPSVVWELDLQGSAGMLEFSGEGLKALVEAMSEKKKQMATLGARLLEDAPTIDETATSAKMRHGGEVASLKTIAQSLEQAFTDVLQICVWWQGTDTRPNEAKVSVALNKEYLNVRATPQEIQVALTALQSGEMSFETWYNLLVTGGWAREGVNAEQERKDIDTRKPAGTEDPPPLTE